MAIGNLALFFVAISVAQGRAFELSWRDAALLVVVAALVLARFVDVAYLRGKTTEGKPATLADWRRYSLRLVAGVLAIWLVAHGFAATGWLQ